MTSSGSGVGSEGAFGGGVLYNIVVMFSTVSDYHFCLYKRPFNE